MSRLILAKASPSRYIKDNLQILERPSKGLHTPNTSPFLIKKKIGHLYELELSDWMKVHPIFHVDWNNRPWPDEGVPKH